MTATFELVVEDNGPGIPPELAPTLFERFVRGAGDRGGSFGLGLAIVQAVAVSHGGIGRPRAFATRPDGRALRRDDARPLRPRRRPAGPSVDA